MIISIRRWLRDIEVRGDITGPGLIQLKVESNLIKEWKYSESVWFDPILWSHRLQTFQRQTLFSHLCCPCDEEKARTNYFVFPKQEDTGIWHSGATSGAAGFQSRSQEDIIERRFKLKQSSFILVVVPHSEDTKEIAESYLIGGSVRVHHSAVTHKVSAEDPEEPIYYKYYFFWTL